MRIADVERRQWELWTIALFVILVFALTVIHLALFTENKSVFLIFLGVFSVLFCLYVVEREGKLLVLAKRLRQEEMQILDEQGKVSLLNAHLKELAALHKAGEAVSLERAHQRSLDDILSSAMELFEADRGSIMLLDEQGENLLITSARGVDPKWLKHPQKSDEGVAGWVLQTGEPLLLATKPSDSRFVHITEKDSDIKSAICVPLRVRDRVVGVLSCCILEQHRKTEPHQKAEQHRKTFTEYDLKLLSVFALYASIAIENAQLKVSLHKALKS